MSSDGIADLMEAGIVDNPHKEIDPAVTVATMLMGTSRLYRFADRLPTIPSGLPAARLWNGTEGDVRRCCCRCIVKGAKAGSSSR